MINDEQIGRNLTALRADMSQKELAAQMRTRGFKWSQATVWAVEKGERPLRLTESEALGAIFDIHGSALLATKSDFERTMQARVLSDKLQEISDLAYASFERQRRIAIAFDFIPRDDRDEGITPELVARNAVDYALVGLARAEAHYRGERELDEMMDGPMPDSGHEYHDAFLAHVREQIEERRRQTSAEGEREHADGIDQAEK